VDGKRPGLVRAFFKEFMNPPFLASNIGCAILLLLVLSNPPLAWAALRQPYRTMNRIYDRSFGIPSCCRNDTAARATLLNLGSAQVQFQRSLAVDLDGDGLGEFGTFGEMTATSGVRSDAGAAVRGSRVRPAVLSPSLSNTNSSGTVTKAGYCFRVYLPANDHAAAREGRSDRPFSRAVNTDLAEKKWVAYSWPVAYGNSGNLAFVTDWTGALYECDNAKTKWQGSSTGPSFDAAFPVGGKAWTRVITAGAKSRSGQVWRKLR
jgi:hypothetical protein